MRQTVVGVFDQFSAAQHAADLLRQRGIDDDDIHVTAADEGDGEDTTQRAQPHEKGVLERIKEFFSGDVDDEAEMSTYSEHVRRGGAVLKVDVEDEPQVDMACETLQSAGAVDIDARVDEWKAGGWSALSAAGTTAGTASAGKRPAAEHEADLHEAERSRSKAAEGEEVIPVIEEEVQIGKRAVKAGGVRVYAHTVQDKVHESVNLREERAHVERRPADRPASEADLQALGERTIEVEETVERPVVQKTARVVEEVVVGKDVRDKKADVDETVRRTEVDVKRMGGDERQRAYENFDRDFRADFDSRHADSGRRYEEVEPAYRFGHTLASDERYAGRSWDEIDADARSAWTRDHPGSAWDEVKASVRHAWERVKS